MNTFEPDNVVDKTLIIRRLPVNIGIRWFMSAFSQFKAYPFIWITFVLIYLSINFIALLHPVLSFLSICVLPILQGGLFIAAKVGDTKKTPRIEDLMIFNIQLVLKLVIVGVIWGLICLLFSELFITVALAGASASELSPENIAQHMNNLSLSTFLALISLLAGFVLLSVAYSITPGLILFNQLNSLAVWRVAISACAQNWQAIILYLFILSILGLLASLPFFLGWIIFLPVLILTHFYLWQSIFGDSVTE